MISLKRLKSNYSVILLFAITFIIYLCTLMPGTGYSGDVAKFQFLGRVLGISHTPGYPAFTMLGHIFNYIPFGTPAWKMNMMAAFFGSLTAVLLFFIVMRLLKNRTIALFSGLLFAVSRTFWSQAVVAEVYTLNAFYITAVILSLIIWNEDKDNRYFFLACFLYAMSFGHHLSMILLVPAIVFFIIITDHRVLLKPSNLLICAGFFALAALQYSYVFIRTYNPSVYVEMRVYNLEDFMWWITGGQFKGKMFSFTLKQVILDRIPYYISQLKSQFHPIGLVAGLIGACILLRDRLKYAAFFFLIFFGNLFFSLNYGVGDAYVFFIPSFIVFAVFIAVGLEAALKKLRTISWLKDKQKKHAFTAGLVILFLVVFTANLPVANQRNNVWTDDFVDIILNNVKDKSLILTPGYDWGQFYLYKLIGEDKRRGDGIKAHWYWDPSVIYDSYPSYVSRPDIDRASEQKFKGNFVNRDATIISPYMFNMIIPKEMTLCFHRGSRKKLKRTGFNSQKLLSIRKHGVKAEIYEIIPEKQKPKDKFVSVHAPKEETKHTRRTRKMIEKFHRKGRIKIDFSVANAAFLGNGWSRPELSDADFPCRWADALESGIIIPVKTPQDYEMEVKIHSLYFENAPVQQVRVLVNGEYVSTIIPKGVWEIYTVSIPSKYWITGENKITFVSKYLASPIEVLFQGDPREISIAVAFVGVRSQVWTKKGQAVTQ